MEIFDYAMQVEKEGEECYRSLANSTDSKELKTLFNWLADAEVRHYQIFKRLKNKEGGDFEETPILENAVSVFEQIKTYNDGEFLKDLQADAYEKAKAVETRMAEFYVQKAEEADSDEQKELLLKVADEEKRHQHVLENLIAFANNPETWLKEDRFKEILNYYPL